MVNGSLNIREDKLPECRTTHRRYPGKHDVLSMGMLDSQNNDGIHEPLAVLVTTVELIEETNVGCKMASQGDAPGL